MKRLLLICALTLRSIFDVGPNTPNGGGAGAGMIMPPLPPKNVDVSQPTILDPNAATACDSTDADGNPYDDDCPAEPTKDPGL